MAYRGMREHKYYLAIPDGGHVKQGIVLVHGISRNVKPLLESFWPLVRHLGIALLAPLFSESVYKDFQRLGRVGRGPRADIALNSMLAEAASVSRWRLDKAFYFGHSAGAQFVQRFMIAHPQQVKKAALSAAGWYTFPVETDYPAGIRRVACLPDVAFEPRRFLRVPTAVFIGLEDTLRDKSLNRSRKIDRQQGRNRLERARKWVSAMQNAAHLHAMAPLTELFEIAGISHDYSTAVESAGLSQQVLAWFLSD